MNSNFIYDNYLNIIIFVIFTFLFLTISQLKWNFNPDIHPPKLIKEYTWETMTNMEKEMKKDMDADFLKINPSDGFCESFLGDASNLEISCNKLTKDRCFKTSCCVYTDNNKCVAGSEQGPTFKTDEKGNPVAYNYYYHKGIKY